MRGRRLFNPYVLLAVGVVWLASVGTAYLTGNRHATNAAKAAQATATAKMIEQHRENTVIDMQAAVEAESKRQAVRIEYRDRINTVERIVREKPSSCRVSDDVFRLLGESIDSANTASAAKPVTVPAAAETSVKPQ